MIDPADDYPEGCPECGCRVHVEQELDRFRRPGDRLVWVARCVDLYCQWSHVEDADEGEPAEEGEA